MHVSKDQRGSKLSPCMSEMVLYYLCVSCQNQDVNCQTYTWCCLENIKWELAMQASCEEESNLLISIHKVTDHFNFVFPLFYSHLPSNY